MSFSSDQHSTGTVRPESTRHRQCQFCQCLQSHRDVEDRIGHGNLPYLRERIFHEECTTCLPLEPSLKPLCAFCNHLRLPHIFGCVTPKLKDLPWSFSEVGFEITWGKGYEELRGDQTCPLCALISTVMRSRATTIKQDEAASLADEVSVELFPAQVFDTSKPGSWEMQINFPKPNLQLRSPAVITMNMAKDVIGRAAPSEPLIGLGVNWDLARQWVRNCHLDHSSREAPIDSTDKGFRLIDVRNNCVITASKSWSYAALSYVWGDSGARKSQAVLANVSQLEQKGGLLLHELPQCILDALKACKCLGIEFLWVDRFCIVQDDAQSKHGQIKQMGNIYASAVVTIVAAAGKDADHGLPGVSKPRAFAQQRLVLQGVEFTEIHHRYHFSEPMEKSVWRSRGWTFQEEVLSTALLVFTERGILFQCKHLPGKMWVEGRSRETAWAESYPYPVMVAKYSERKLSFESDILNAFSGYLNMMFKDEHYFGLPCAYFNQALLWRSADDSGLPREGNGNETFSTLSWESTTGAVDYQSWLRPGDHESVAFWAAILYPPGRTSPQLFPVCEMPSKLASLRELLRTELYGTHWEKESVWRRGILKQRLLSPIIHGELSRFWTTFPQQVMSKKRAWFQNRWFSNVITSLMPREVFQAGRLLAYTQIANISVTRLLWPTWTAHKKDGLFVLRNKWGKWIGFVNPDKHTAERIDSYSLRGEIYSAECLALSLHRERDSFELLLDEDLDTIQDREREPEVDEEAMRIFRRRSHDFWAEMGCLKHRVEQETKRNAKDIYERSPKFDRGLAFPPQLTVMMVERTEGVARRVGVGNVYLKRWRESAPSFQSVVLE